MQQTLAARQAWRDEAEYSLILDVVTEPEPGLSRADMSGSHALPLNREVLRRVHDASVAGGCGARFDVGASAPISPSESPPVLTLTALTLTALI